MMDEPKFFKSQLVALGSCAEAVEWVGNRTLAEAWAECPRADWMLWLVGRIDGTYTTRLRQAACACARTALKYIPAGEDRPRLAIECAERYARGEATKVELAAAWDAAWAAARAAAGAAAWDAARAAAWDVAWDAAWDAARDAARAAAWDAAHLEMANIIRGIIKSEELEVKP